MTLAGYMRERRVARLRQQPAQRTPFSTLLLFGASRPGSVYPYLQRFSTMLGVAPMPTASQPEAASHAASAAELQNILSAELWRAVGLTQPEQAEQASKLRAYRVSEAAEGGASKPYFDSSRSATCK